MCKLMCEEVEDTATNLAIDQKLLEEAKRIGKKKTKKETVNEALAEYIQRRKRIKILDLFSQVEWEEDYDYKAKRHR